MPRMCYDIIVAKIDALFCERVTEQLLFISYVVLKTILWDFIDRKKREFAENH